MNETLGHRAFAAFRLALALFFGGGAALGGLALAHGPFNPAPFFAGASSAGSAWNSSSAQTDRSEASPSPHRRVRAADDDEAANRASRRKRSNGAADSGRYLRGGVAVCVRLCDGAYFPAIDAAGGDAACQAQCPDAPVALYSMPGDDIGSAVSLTGARYASLPVALRHRSVFDNTCSCRRASATTSVAAWRRDRTLRKGDVVATVKGFVVFSGAGNDSARRFVALAKSDLERDRKADLLAMERASTLAGWDGPSTIRRGGTITVSDAGAP